MFLLFVAFLLPWFPQADRKPDEADAKAIAAIERALKDSKGGPVGVTDAIRDLRADSVAAAQVLVKAFTQLETQAQQIDAKAHSNVARGKASPGEVEARRREIDPIRRAQAAALDQVDHLRDPAALAWLVENVVGDEKLALSLKKAALKAAAREGESIVPPLQRGLAKAKQPDDVVTILLAVQELERLALPLADAIVPLVDHPEASVREQAALALAKIASPKGIEPLVRRLGMESDRTQIRFAAALEMLTRQKLGATPSAWQGWLAAEGLRFTSGQEQLGGGEVAVQQKASGYFHGIPQDARSIVYVVDVSGSMIVSSVNPVFEGQPPRPIPSPPGEESRLEVSKKELVKALGQLPEGTRFNIITFAFTAERWSPKLVEASSATIKKAQKFVEELGAEGSTNIYDAMENAFALAGRGAADKYYGSTLDTIFLLTDGQPTVGSKDDDPNRILDSVRRMNPLKRVVVHAIGLGNGIDSRFLGTLASENGGVFVQR